MAKSSPIALETRAVTDARLASPSAARNKAVIAGLLADRLGDGARVLEIASGTGEHAVEAVRVRPDLTWCPSDIDAHSLASQAAWAGEADGRVRPPARLDVAAPDWWVRAPVCDAVFCANMIHIAPWAAAQGLFSGAAALLRPSEPLFLYGPFLEGASTAPSNLDFDVSLKSRDSRWGVRALADVDDLAASTGFKRVERVETPANNRFLRFERVSA